ncbi:MAG: hypothetical protein ABR530_06495, partial [Pyrinomonadaceae bacterium]
AADDILSVRIASMQRPDREGGRYTQENTDANNSDSAAHARVPTNARVPPSLTVGPAQETRNRRQGADDILSVPPAPMQRPDREGGRYTQENTDANDSDSAAHARVPTNARVPPSLTVGPAQETRVQHSETFSET